MTVRSVPVTFRWRMVTLLAFGVPAAEWKKWIALSSPLVAALTVRRSMRMS